MCWSVLVEFVCYPDVVKRRWIIGLGAAATVAGILFAVWPRDPQPKYKGKRLQDWLLVISHPDPMAEGPPVDEALIAVRQIGTNGIPYFLEWVRYREPAWRTRTDMALRRLFTGHRVRAREQRIRDLGWFGLQRLGTEGAPAIPTLNRWMNDPTDFRLSVAAMCTLGHMGAPAMPQLMAALTNTANRLRGQAAFQLATMGEEAEVAVPALVQALNSPDKSFAENVAMALGQRVTQPEIVVPALVHLLSDTPLSVRQTAAKVLAAYGHTARSAIPVLLKALDDPDPVMRELALIAIECIAPEELSGECP